MSKLPQMPTCLSSFPPNYSVWKEAVRPDGSAAVLIDYEGGYCSHEYFTVGWFDSLQEAYEGTAHVFELFGDETVNVFKETKKLFPHIKGAMIINKPVVMTLSGKVKEVMPDGNADKSRMELYFLVKVNDKEKEYDKTAIVNSSQILKLARMFGEESDNWRGERVVLYAEEGTAFGKPYCSIRIADMTDPAAKQLYGHLLRDKTKKNGAQPAPQTEEPLKLFDEPKLVDDGDMLAFTES